MPKFENLSLVDRPHEKTRPFTTVGPYTKQDGSRAHLYNLDQRRYAKALNFAQRGEFYAIDPDILIKHYSNLQQIRKDYLTSNPVESLKEGLLGLELNWK